MNYSTKLDYVSPAFGLLGGSNFELETVSQLRQKSKSLLMVPPSSHQTLHISLGV